MGTRWTMIGWTLAVSVLSLPGCRAKTDEGPPDIRLGESVCVECGMIVSDERFGTATIIDGVRGREPLIFDDFNCQMNYEAEHAELVILDRWSRDYDTLEWFHTHQGWFVESPELRTPMASNLAAYARRDDADTKAEDLNADVIAADQRWNRD
ncbi:MAG: nitrous oxide reductase accessory protein NosL [Phycisphaerales bacterium]